MKERGKCLEGTRITVSSLGESSDLQVRGAGPHILGQHLVLSKPECETSSQLIKWPLEFINQVFHLNLSERKKEIAHEILEQNLLLKMSHSQPHSGNGLMWQLK